MASQGRRSRSTTSASTKLSHRPASRASTTSLRSNGTHEYQVDQTHQYQPVSIVPQVPIESHSTHIGYAPPHSLPPEAALLQHSAQHFAANGVPLHIANGGYINAAQSFGQVQTPDYASGVQNMPQTQLNVPEADTGKRKGNGASATNDKELRELLARNECRPLREVANEVIANERTSKAEKSKQLFAMLWLKQTCKSAKTSVPRNRVYSHYAQRCGTERVVPLNPASFGKLVRVIFPGIQTRRLGVRGESKYHYVDLALVDENPSDTHLSKPDVRTIRHNSIGTPQVDFNSLQARFPTDTAVLNSAEQSLDSQPSMFPATSRSRGCVFTNVGSPGFSQRSPTSELYSYELKFPSQVQENFQENDSIELPNIHSYTPPKTDEDAANALTALYRTHCTSLIDCIRFCKEKLFFRLFTSFHGTLTVPVQKLLVHPQIAPWIRECDWLMYQKMIRFVAQLTLQVAPPVVLKFLDTVSKTLHQHITKVFHGSPAHVLEAKLEPATLFAHLLHRMLKTNQAAHAAAALLMADANRDQMWRDWVQYVNPKRVIESELPNCGYEEVYKILTSDIRSLLQPLSTELWLESGTHYEQSQLLKNNADPIQVSNDTVIDRLAAFLGNLPSRFPHASTRSLVQCISTIGTAAVREITVENGASFSCWWITKVFVDEMCHWLSALGGFLDHQFPDPLSTTFQLPTPDGPLGTNMSTATISVEATNSNDNSRYSSISADFGATTSFLDTSQDTIQTTKVPEADLNAQQFHEAFSSTHETFTQNHEAFNQTQHTGSDLQSAFTLDLCVPNSSREDDHLDDSGIGMGLIDDSLDLQKFEPGNVPVSADFIANTIGTSIGS